MDGLHVGRLEILLPLPLGGVRLLEVAGVLEELLVGGLEFADDSTLRLAELVQGLGEGGEMGAAENCSCAGGRQAASVQAW